MQRRSARFLHRQGKPGWLWKTKCRSGVFLQNQYLLAQYGGAYYVLRLDCLYPVAADNDI